MRPRLGLAVSAALALGALALALSAAPQPQDARLERLYVKLERLNSLSPLVAGAGEGAGEAELEWEDEQLELIAQLAAEPGVSAEQLDQLIRDLRLAHASSARLVSAAPAAAPPASSAAPPAAADYSDDDWHEEEEEEEEEGDEEEEEEPEYAMDDEEPWDAEETAPARRPQAPPPPRAATDAPRPPDHHDADAENAGSRPSSRRRAALAHLLRAQELGRCQEPSPRVLPVQSLHPHAAKIYLPHCVILHRCAADTGCCLDGTHVCAPLTIQRIRLPFYILSVGSNNVEEELWFYNHTKCTCMNRTDAAASRAANGPLRGGGGGGSVGNMAPRDDESTHRPQQRAVSADIGLMATQEPLVLRRCSCPKEFSASTASEPEGECRCECRERQSDCSRLKKGKEHFGLRDRLCIKRGQCSPPQCEFGEYNTAAGRCPRRRDPLDLPAALAHRAARLTSRLL